MKYIISEEVLNEIFSFLGKQAWGSVNPLISKMSKDLQPYQEPIPQKSPEMVVVDTQKDLPKS